MTEEPNDFKKISEVLGEIISQKHIRVGIDKIRIQEAWRVVMGKNIEKYTSNKAVGCGENITELLSYNSTWQD